MENIFTIETKNTHYVLGVDKNGLLRHLHWGRKANEGDYYISEIGEINSNHSMLDVAELEYTVFGGTMYRNCAFKCQYFDGCRDSVFKFKSASQDNGRLEIVLTDEVYAIDIVLTYLYSSEIDVITRYATVVNHSDNCLKLDKIMSAELTLPSDMPYDVINPNGAWAGEFLLEKTTLNNGTLTFESRKGTAGHTNSPYIILSQNATEDYGEVFFAALGYGGSFKVEAQRDFLNRTRVVLGISDFDFSYNLNAGESFITPKVYFGYSNGYAEMSNMMNDFSVKNILPKQFADKPLPVLYNSWEATGFDVNTKCQLELAKLASNIGCELFVMDDGWFGARNDDWKGLGDWVVNEDKFPNGLDELIEGVNALGMDFGLWFEPEMVQKDSDLFRSHPDWSYHYETRKASELRHQLVLNLTKPEVKGYVFDCMDKMLEKHNIRYIKWDMNRPFSEIGAENLDNPQELWYRHTMAVYEIADALKEKYPYLQIEACASGGGRAELGALEHFDMAWTSDNTDPVDRLAIQYGYSMLYPSKCMRAWVTDWNNDCRPNSLDLRFASSMQGSLSIGADLTRFSEEELEKCKQYISLYKEIRNTVQFGNIYRLKNYKENGFYATQFVSKDKSESVVFIISGAEAHFNKQWKMLSLRGLDENKMYKVFYDDKVCERSGSYLMNIQHQIRLYKPLMSKIVRIIEK